MLIAPGGAAAQSTAANAARDSSRGQLSWSGNVEAYAYLLGADSYVSPIVRADRGALHLEGRYQYERRQTVSAWAGWTLETGASLHLEVVPIAGVVIGRTDGFGVGLEALLSWRTFELYSESELIFDVRGTEGGFYYNWSDLAWQLKPWFDVGLSAQRTLTRESALSIEGGIFVTGRRRRVELSIYGYNLERRAPFAIVALGVQL